MSEPRPRLLADPEYEDAIASRFWANVSKDDDGCWRWTLTVSTGGYGRFGVTKPERRLVTAHRYAYEVLRGPIPKGFYLDHLCRNRICVNPSHLEPVTNRVNILRGESWSAQLHRASQCIRGHDVVGSNVYVNNGKQRCRACYQAKARAYRKRQRRANGIAN